VKFRLVYSSWLLTARKAEHLTRRLAGEKDAHERDHELVHADVSIVDELGSPPVHLVSKQSLEERNLEP